MKKQNVRTLGLIVCTLTYLLIGAALFDFIESEEEKRQKEALEILEFQLLEKYNISSVDFTMLEEVMHLSQPFKAGRPWKFAGSFYYATTVLTTIGYGHSTPKTFFGKMFTMVYAMIGIPLGLVMFNSIGERLNNFSSIVINKLRKSLKAKQAETTEMDLICVVSSLSGIVVTMGAAAFSHYEGWSYFHSIYYCFVTLTTIGFGDYVALQQDNSLGTKPEYVTFALFFIMFGLAIIAASLNLMVLKFMTMNTEDERRDEQQAIQAAAQNVRLDGDIILQQSEVLHWQAEGAGSMEEVRSVCSCTCNSCNPFQQINARYHDELETSKNSHNKKRRKRSRRYSESSILTDDNDTRKNNKRESKLSDHHRRLEANALHEFCDHRGMSRRGKADSVHDLRRSAVSSALRLPPCTPPLSASCHRSSSRTHLRATSAVPTSSPAYVLELHSCGGSRDDFTSLFAASNRARLSALADNNRASSGRRFLKRMLRWPPQLIVLSPTGLENETEIRPGVSYALDEVNAMRVVPKSKNLNHHKRVSL